MPKGEACESECMVLKAAVSLIAVSGLTLIQKRTVRRNSETTGRSLVGGKLGSAAGIIFGIRALVSTRLPVEIEVSKLRSNGSPSLCHPFGCEYVNPHSASS